MGSLYLHCARVRQNKSQAPTQAQNNATKVEGFRRTPPEIPRISDENVDLLDQNLTYSNQAAHLPHHTSATRHPRRQPTICPNHLAPHGPLGNTRHIPECPPPQCGGFGPRRDQKIFSRYRKAFLGEESQRCGTPVPHVIGARPIAKDLPAIQNEPCPPRQKYRRKKIFLHYGICILKWQPSDTHMTHRLYGNRLEPILCVLTNSLPSFNKR